MVCVLTTIQNIALPCLGTMCIFNSKIMVRVLTIRHSRFYYIRCSSAGCKLACRICSDTNRSLTLDLIFPPYLFQVKEVWERGRPACQNCVKGTENNFLAHSET